MRDVDANHDSCEDVQRNRMKMNGSGDALVIESGCIEVERIVVERKK